MTATPALSNDIFGKYQKRISDHLYLDNKQSEGIHIELQKFAAELLSGREVGRAVPLNHLSATNSDPGDEHA